MPKSPNLSKNSKKFHILIFGCQMNYSDSARIKAVLGNCGWQYTDNIDDADVVIFHTCSVRQKAEDKITGKLIEIPKGKKIRITGCMIQHNIRTLKVKKNEKDEKYEKGENVASRDSGLPNPNKLFKKGNFIGTVKINEPEIIGFENSEINDINTRKHNFENTVFVNHAFNPMFFQLHKTYPAIELFFRIDDLGFVPLMMKKLGYEVDYDQEMINEYCQIIPEGKDSNMDNSQISAFVPISTGCNQFCSYCIVPYSRGLEKHFPVEQIVKEVNHHIANGIKEITLLGQIVNKHPHFVQIIKEILKNPDLKRLRYTSPYPNFYSPELLELHENEPKLCPHIHIPMQSGSDAVLGKMFRGYKAEDFKKFIDNIRSLKRHISITTDVIVGFPDETEEDFQNTMDLVQYGMFDMIYIGVYSPRPGTFADKKYPDNISKDVKRDRRNRLNNLLTKISKENNLNEVGKVKEVLITGIENGVFTGRTEDNKTIIVEKSKDQKIERSKDEFVKVKITKGVAFKLYGEIVD